MPSGHLSVQDFIEDISAPLTFYEVSETFFVALIMTYDISKVVLGRSSQASKQSLSESDHRTRQKELSEDVL